MAFHFLQHLHGSTERSGFLILVLKLDSVLHALECPSHFTWEFTMIRTQLLNGTQQLALDRQQLIEQWQSGSLPNVWLDIQTGDEENVDELLAKLGFHPLVIKDALRKRHPPKIELFDQYIFILYRGILQVDEVIEFQHQQIAFFIGENYIVSLHAEKSLGVEHVFEKIMRASYAKSSLQLGLEMMHASAGIYLASVLDFENKLSDMEDALQTDGNDQMMGELISYRSRLVKLRRIFSYHQSITNALKIAHDDKKLDLHQEIHEIIDLHDRFERLHSLVQMHYEICGDLIDGYLSISSHQLNATMRVLTVITAVFVPLSFLAGLYGMNFEFMPELKYQYGYYGLLVLMGVVAIGLLSFFRKKRWI